MKFPPFITNSYAAWIASLSELIVNFPPLMIILPLLSVSSESGSDLIPSLLLFIMIVPSLIVIKLSQARAFFTAVISKVPPLIIAFCL